MKIESTVKQVVVPANRLNVTRSASAFDQMLDSLEIGSGFDYTTGAKNKAGEDVAPHLKAQYGRAPSSKWAPKGKTFKIFQAEDQSGLVEGLEVRYTVARVEFVEPIKRAKKAKPAEGQVEGNDGQDNDNGHDAE